jgi:hypothetical protein
VQYDRENKVVTIPIVAEEQIGIVRIAWLNQLPIVAFNRVLKLVELLKLVITEFAKIATRLGYYTLEYETNAWNEKLYSIAFRE